MSRSCYEWADQLLKDLGAGYNIASPMYPGKMSIKPEGPSVCTVIFRTEHSDTQIEFKFDEFFPCRIPSVTINSTTLTFTQKEELKELLRRKGKVEEYTNTFLLPLLLDTASVWIREKHGKGKITPDTSQKKSRQNDDQQLKPKENKGKDTKINGDGSKSRRKTVSPESEQPLDDCSDFMLDVLEHYKEEEASINEWSYVSKSKSRKSAGSKATSKFTIDTVPHVNVPEDSRRANYFVAIRCTNTEIGDAVENVVRDIQSEDEAYKLICYNRNEVHVTLTTLALHTDKEVESAVKALEDATEVLANHAPTSCLEISGIDNFQNSKVVYGKVKVAQDVLLLRKVVRWCFRKARIAPRDNNDYVPHMTVAKVNAAFTKITQLQNIPRNVYDHLLDTCFGKQGIKGIYLCKMGRERRDDGFYVSPGTVMFKK